MQVLSNCIVYQTHPHLVAYIAQSYILHSFDIQIVDMLIYKSADIQTTKLHKQKKCVTATKQHYNTLARETAWLI